jgi:long-chain acyl-CoA synthetase
MSIINELEICSITYDKPFLHFKDKIWSYEKFKTDCYRFLAFLKENFGLMSKKNIALLSFNSPEFLFSVFGLLANRNQVVLINAALAPSEVLYILNDADVDSILISEQLYTIHSSMLSKWGKKVIRLKNDWNSTIVETSSTISQTNLESISPDNTAFILYTSGTTGFPKGVELTHSNILNEAKLFAETMKYTSKDKHLCFLPLYHVFALLVSFFSTFISGGEFHLLEKFHATNFWEEISHNHITSFTAVPTVLNILTSQDNPKQDISSLEYCISGAASLSIKTLEEFQKRFCPIREGYGLSECTCAVSVNPRHGPIRVGSVGKALKNIDIIVIDDEKQELVFDSHKIGKLLVSGPIVMKGYYKDMEATKEVLFEINKKTWLDTGDLAYIDDEGYIFLKGRTKDMIITKGENVYPIEVEKVLNSYPGIKETAVIGMKHDIYGEIPIAYIISDHESLQINELNKYVELHLAEFKRPKAFIRIDKFPRNSLQKIQKSVLRSFINKHQTKLDKYDELPKKVSLARLVKETGINR